jgi:acetyltransferase-like isoleucine patch superfamily enzyme
MRVFKLLIRTGILKTIYYNFKLLPFKEAILIPILISKNTRVIRSDGVVKILNRISTGMIKIGFGEVDIFDRNSITIISLKGKDSSITFRGKAFIGQGSKLSIDGQLKLGENFTITAHSQIWCKKRIEFGDNNLISWDVLMVDTDGHKILNESNSIINKPSEIIIGSNNWIGCRTIILKGTLLGDGNVVAAGSLLSGSHCTTECSIIAGRPGKVIKDNIKWEK